MDSLAPKNFEPGNPPAPMPATLPTLWRDGNSQVHLIPIFGAVGMVCTVAMAISGRYTDAVLILGLTSVMALISIYHSTGPDR